MSHKITIMIGSNAEHRRALVEEAISRLSGIVGMTALSSPLESADYSGGSKPYLNVVARAESRMTESEILANFKNIELAMGRNFADRDNVLIDIDLVEFDGNVVKQTEYASTPFQTGIKQIASL